LYIDDALEAIHAVILSDYEKPLNIGSDQFISINELADLIIEISHKKVTKEYDSSKPQGVRGRNADLTLISEITGWRPKTTYREGLEKTYRWIYEMVNRTKNG